MNIDWLKVNPLKELRESCPVRFWEIGLQSWQISKSNGWVPTFRGGGTHWVFLATPWFFAWTQFDWRSIQWESYVNPVLCVFEKLAYKVGIFHKKLAEFLRFMGAVLIEFSLRQTGSLHEPSLTEGQSSDWVTWILSCAFLRSWLTKLANFKKQWLSSYASWWRYSLSFPCDTLVHCMNIDLLKVNPVRELRESCPVRFWEIGLQSWQISKNNFWVPTFHGGCTLWVFLETPWFFEWTQFDWRSIQWKSYVNPVLWVFEKLAYKVGIFHKTLAEFLRFVLAVLIEFSLQRPGSLHEHSLTEGQSSERVTWFFEWTQFVSWWRYSLSFSCNTLFLCMNTVWLKVNPLGELRESCPVQFLRNWLTKLVYFTKNWLSSYVS